MRDDAQVGRFVLLDEMRWTGTHAPTLMARKPRTRKPLSYGPVLVSDGPLKGRIGYYDDDSYNDERDCDEAIVYLGRLILTQGYHFIPLEYLSPVTTQSLMRRRDAIMMEVAPYSESPLKGDKRADALQELHLIDALLADRMMSARLNRARKGARLFISHSSKDKAFATWLAVDLKDAGYEVWFDEWDIKVGESIPHEIGVGLDRCDFVAVVLSSHAAESRWVENEWHAKYWDEIEQGRVRVLPLLIEDCKIPTLLKTKKYADFRNDHANGLEDLLHSLSHFSRK